MVFEVESLLAIGAFVVVAAAAAAAGGRLVAVLCILADAEMDCVVVFEGTGATDATAGAAGVGAVAGGLFSGADSTTVAGVVVVVVVVVVVGSVDPGVEVGTNNIYSNYVNDNASYMDNVIIYYDSMLHTVY